MYRTQLEVIDGLGCTYWGDEGEALWLANQEAARRRLEAITPNCVYIRNETSWACPIRSFYVDFSVNGEALRHEVTKILTELQEYPCLDEKLYAEEFSTYELRIAPY